jgi:quercetin dioxygenase-like cupin family protein
LWYALTGAHTAHQNVVRVVSALQRAGHPAKPGGEVMARPRKWFIRNIAEVPWRQFPDHFGGALSKPLVMAETAGSQHIDYRISMYQPMAYVKLHRHKVQEQVYHVLEGEGLMQIDGNDRVVRKGDYIFLPPGVDHSISNTGLTDLIFLVVTSPVSDEAQ